jgi:hypothetical protein
VGTRSAPPPQWRPCSACPWSLAQARGRTWHSWPSHPRCRGSLRARSGRWAPARERRSARRSQNPIHGSKGRDRGHSVGATAGDGSGMPGAAQRASGAGGHFRWRARVPQCRHGSNGDLGAASAGSSLTGTRVGPSAGRGGGGDGAGTVGGAGGGVGAVVTCATAGGLGATGGVGPARPSRERGRRRAGLRPFALGRARDEASPASGAFCTRPGRWASGARSS